MLSEKEINLLKNGAYGVTSSGRKVKFIEYDPKYDKGDGLPYIYAIRDRNDDWGIIPYKTLTSVSGKGEEDYNDIVGLWKEQPEPFDLERALAGEAFKHGTENTNCKCYLVGKSRVVDEYHVEESDDDFASFEIKLISLSRLQRKYVMWKEPESQMQSVLELPKPITEIGDLEEVWRIGFNSLQNKFVPIAYPKETEWEHHYEMLKNGCLYATKENCQKAIDIITGKN